VPADIHVVVVARGGILGAQTKELHAEMHGLLSTLGLAG
jgi:hypothetical protein